MNGLTLFSGTQVIYYLFFPGTQSTEKGNLGPNLQIPGELKEFFSVLKELLSYKLERTPALKPTSHLIVAS